MSATSIVRFHRPSARSRKRVDLALLAAGALFALLLVGELGVIVHAAPTIDTLAPYYVT